MKWRRCQSGPYLPQKKCCSFWDTGNWIHRTIFIALNFDCILIPCNLEDQVWNPPLLIPSNQETWRFSEHRSREWKITADLCHELRSPSFLTNHLPKPAQNYPGSKCANSRGHRGWNLHKDDRSARKWDISSLFLREDSHGIAYYAKLTLQG